MSRLFKELGTENLKDRYPNEVSVGQRQIGALVRALALKPKYLLLDEVTSALDVEYIAMVLNRIKRLKAEGVAVLIVSHLLNFAKSSADQVVFMVGGKVVESGPTEILEAPNSKRLASFLGLVSAPNNANGGV